MPKEAKQLISEVLNPHRKMDLLFRSNQPVKMFYLPRSAFGKGFWHRGGTLFYHVTTGLGKPDCIFRRR